MQFVFMIVHGSAMLLMGCEYPSRVSLTYVLYIAFMLALFGNFYIRKHLFGGKKVAAKKE